MKLFRNRPSSRLTLWGAVMALALVAGVVAAQEPIGKVQQGLVGGELVTEKTQEAYGLLSLEDPSGGCSASLLRNGWAISAAHCVDAKDGNGNAMRDPARPGQNILRPVGGFEISAAWGGGQLKHATRIETFWPSDIALIQLDSPMQVNGQATGYVREVFLDQFPYFGTPTNVEMTVFGRGINQFATGKGAAAKPSTSDNKYRMGKVRVSKEAGPLYWYPTNGNLMIAGGDSGGSTFTTVGTSRKTVLVGVHALTLSYYVPGKPTKGWTWVSSTPEAADAIIKPVWPQIEKIMGPLPTVPTPPEPFTGRHSATFETTVPFSTAAADRHFILYGVKENGDLVWHRHLVKGTGATAKHVWNPTKIVGNGWKGGFQAVLPAGLLAMYAIQDDGTMQWHWHTGSTEGSYRWREPMQVVGKGWSTTSSWKIMPMDHGVVYTIGQDGYPCWQKHLNYKDGTGGTSLWMAPRNVGWGWKEGYKTVFAGGDGVFYAVRNDGVLMWHKHKSYLNPPSVPANNASNADKLKWQNSWDEAKIVGYGWDDMPQIFAAGDGYIYGIRRNGDLMWFHHLGWEAGTPTWEVNTGVKIASGWDSYAFAFARQTTSDLGSNNPEVDIVVK
ncbi:trypsin-like serine protease [bacterium]|nr:MAG: trypsin-like serine protease [bacterium]